MSVATRPRAAGTLLRDWRHRRRLSQLALAIEADVSARHLSFVETGRSQPSRELLLHLAEHLDVPLRERNDLLLAAGYAPLYQHTPLDADEMAPVRDALHKLLAGHDPFPGVVVDRKWDIVVANDAALAIMSDNVAPELLAPPVNALRVSLHPEGLAPRIGNLAEYGSHLLERLQRELVASGDRDVAALYEELRAYPGVEVPSASSATVNRLFVPLVLRVGEEQQLTFFSTIAAFGTARDITVAELSIELFFPGDEATAAALLARKG